MDSDLQILTLPYNTDLSSLYSQTNNNIAIVLIVFQSLLLISIVLISFLVPLNDKSVQKYLAFNESNESNDKLLSPYSVTIYCHIVIWFVILVIRYYMRSVYYRRLRILGYYKHHSLVKTLSLIPSLVLHKTNALLLLLSTILYMYGQNVVKIGDKIHLKATNFEQIIITISVAIISPFLMKWLYHEIRFRRDRNPPDIFCVEDPQHLVTSAGLNEIGVRPSSYLEDLLEKQADLIYNLKLQNTHLRQMLYKVTQRSARESLQSS
ncbi:unnamed protein product [Oppiella nova]|uniref:Transmembrane protein 192 n=1 Tax=Oppiella nova TaxID=334625 RepID=A0A7R9LDG6_9ACAR|nr:unnamed protein product [Oppiella nova]CAG2161880.1 unnamed protein product [Oppiella nova]